MAQKLPLKQEQKIINCYAKSLKIPSQKIGPIIVCPVRPVGAGKSTVMKLLCPKLKLIRIDLDGLRKLLKKEGMSYDRVHQMAIKLTDQYLAHDYGVGLDGNGGRKEIQKEIKQLAKKYKSKIFWLHIKPPQSYIINKLKNYHHTWLFKDAKQAIHNYQSTKNNYVDGRLPYLSTIDPSKPTIKKQIDKTVKLIITNPR